MFGASSLLIILALSSTGRCIPIDTMILTAPAEIECGKVPVVVFKPEGDPIPLIISVINVVATGYAFLTEPSPKTGAVFAVQVLILADRISKYRWVAFSINLTVPVPTEWILNEVNGTGSFLNDD